MLGPSRRIPICFLLTAVAASACNRLTGVDDLRVTGGAGGGQSRGPGSAGATVGVTPSSSSSSSSGIAAGEGGSAPAPPPDVLIGARGATVTSVAVYQAVRRPLMDGGQEATSEVPVVAGRDALVRVFFQTDATYDGQPVTARLTVGSAAPIDIVGPLSGTPAEDMLDSTLNFSVSGALLTAGATYKVELLQLGKAADDSVSARWPATGAADLHVQSSGDRLRVMIVPIAYGADGSNRLPDTSPAQLQAYEDAMYRVYPIPKVEISVHAPFTWSSPIGADGTGWGDVLDAIAKLRQADQPADDLYYYGAFEPNDSFGSFCGGGCMAGLGYIIGAGDASFRAAVGLGYTGVGEGTMPHEIGHNHGRNHAPCGTSGDAAYPYPDADIGAWGYDLLAKKLFAPDQTKDLMSYCGPTWISDYNYEALFDRLKMLNGASIAYLPDAIDQTYDRARVGADGSLTWLPSMELHTPPLSNPTPISLTTSAGTEAATAHYIPYDHLPGGVLLWPQSQRPATAVSLSLAGRALHLSR